MSISTISHIKLTLLVAAVVASDLRRDEERTDNSSFDQYDLFIDNPDKTDDGEWIFEGDIAIPNGTEYEEMFRKSTLNVLTLWPSGNVSYNFHSSVNDKVKNIIRSGIEEWEEHTCLRFKEKTQDWWFLRFRTDKGGCWSYVGHTLEPLVGQDVSIGAGCETRHIVVHEIGHAIGLYHEQSRSDRDQYIALLWQNMEKGKDSQFRKTLGLDYGVKYDLSSIMHYSPMAFSKQVFEKNTVVSKNPHFQRLMGSGTQLTFRDTKIVNKIYSCDFSCPNKEKLQCKNDGYISPFKNDGQPCKCICPPGTSGEHCEQTIGDYYGPLPCGGNVTEEATIETPNYPERKVPYQSCAWWIQAPSGKKVSVLFKDFSFAGRFNRPGHRYHNICTSERVEIRTEDRYQGTMYCGTDISPETKMTSKSNFFIIILQAAANLITGRGLKAKISFV